MFIFSNSIEFFVFRPLRNVVQAQQRSGVLELSVVGERGFRHRLRVQHALVRPNEALRHAFGPDNRLVGIHRGGDFTQAKAEKTKSNCRGSKSGSSRGEPAGRNGRRKR